MPDVIGGQCACGDVRFEVDAVVAMTHCHCSICRKLSGAVFGTYVHVPADSFRLLSGDADIREYESTPGSFRRFCGRCGSPVPGQAPYLETVSVPAGLLDDDPGVKPSLHLFTGSKAPWWDITDELTQFETWVPGYGPND